MRKAIISMMMAMFAIFTFSSCGDEESPMFDKAHNSLNYGQTSLYEGKDKLIDELSKAGFKNETDAVNKGDTTIIIMKYQLGNIKANGRSYKVTETKSFVSDEDYNAQLNKLTYNLFNETKVKADGVRATIKFIRNTGKIVNFNLTLINKNGNTFKLDNDDSILINQKLEGLFENCKNDYQSRGRKIYSNSGIKLIYLMNSSLDFYLD